MTGAALVWHVIGAGTALAARLMGMVIVEELVGRSRPSMQSWATSTVEHAAGRLALGDPGALHRAIGTPRASPRRHQLMLALAARADAEPRIAHAVATDAVVRLRVREWVLVELGSSDADRRAAAVEVCGSLRPDGYLDLVRAATLDADDAVQACACAILLRDDPTTAEGVLLRLIEEDGRWAAELLAPDARGTSFSPTMRSRHWGPSAALATVMPDLDDDTTDDAVLLGSSDDSTVVGALHRLDSDGVARTRHRIVSLLDRDHESIRLAAVQAIGRSAGRTPVMELAALVGDRSRTVRLAAARSVAAIGGRAALDALANELLPRTATLAVDGADDLVAAAEAVATARWELGPTEEAA
jgi:HEAT repeat protein